MTDALVSYWIFISI